MSDTVQIPPISEIRSRMVACREELTALKRLLRLAQAAAAAEAARQRREQGVHAEGSSRA